MTRRARAFVLVAAGPGGRARAERGAALLASSAAAGAVRGVAVDGPAGALAAVRALDGDETPIAVGGDGTINLLARALLEAGLGARLFGILPLGTGNAVAHALGVVRERAALDALVTGEVQALDVFLTDHPEAPVVVASVSVGMEARFIHRLAAERAAGRGWTLGRAALASHLVRGRVSGVLLELDGRAVVRPAERIYNAGLYNYPTYGFGAPVLPSASPCDGVGEAQVRRGPGVYWRALLLGARGRLAPLPWRTAVLECAEPTQIDGEPGPAGRFPVRLAPGALRVLVPAG